MISEFPSFRFSNFLVAHGAVPTFPFELDASNVRRDTASREADQEQPQAMHSS
jgi:hypothetical protein